MIWIAALALALATLGACASNVPEVRHHPRPIHESGRWTRAWPASLTDVYINAKADCVFLDGVVSDDAGQRARKLQCVDPSRGDVRWEVGHPLSADRKRGAGLHFAKDHVILRAEGALISYRRVDGEEAWRYSGEEGASLYRAFLEGQTLVVDVDNRHLVLLDAADGDTVRTCPITLPVIAVVEASMGLVAVGVEVDPEDSDRGKLVGLPLGEACDTDTQIAPAWSVTVEKWNDDIVFVGGALIGEFFDGELTALDPSSGERLWAMKAHQLGDKLLFSRERIIVAEANLPPTNPAFEGQVLRLRGIHPAAVEDRTRMWEMEVPTDYDLLGVEGGTDEGRSFAATADRFFVYDAARGQLQWSYHISPGARLGWWSTASANAEAVFVFFEREGKAGTLQRIPIVLE